MLATTATSNNIAGMTTKVSGSVALMPNTDTAKKVMPRRIGVAAPIEAPLRPVNTRPGVRLHLCR